MLNLNNLHFEYSPYPHGVAKNVFDVNTYKEIVENFPDINKFYSLKNKNKFNKEEKFNKFSLSSKNNPKIFFDFVNNNSSYKKLSNFLFSYDFKINLFNILIKNNINLGIIPLKRNNKNLLRNFLLNFTPYNILKPLQDVDVAIEFSAIPVRGGFIKPHTDGPHKLLSIVIPVIDKSWQDSFNGGTNFLKPKDNTKIYNILNNTYEFDQCDIIKTVNFNSNQLLIFLKTYNSFHSVGPLNGEQDNLYRKSITLTIEKKVKY